MTESLSLQADRIVLESPENFLPYEDFPDVAALEAAEIDSLNSRFLEGKTLLYNASVRAVGVIATSRRFTIPYVVQEAVAARGTIVKLRDELVEERLITEEGNKGPSALGGRPTELFRPTSRLYGYIRENSEWERAAKLCTVGRRFNMKQGELLDSMITQVLDRYIGR